MLLALPHASTQNNSIAPNVDCRCWNQWNQWNRCSSWHLNWRTLRECVSKYLSNHCAHKWTKRRTKRTSIHRSTQTRRCCIQYLTHHLVLITMVIVMTIVLGDTYGDYVRLILCAHLNLLVYACTHSWQHVLSVTLHRCVNYCAYQLLNDTKVTFYFGFSKNEVATLQQKHCNSTWCALCIFKNLG